MSAIKGKPNYKRRTGRYKKCYQCNKKTWVVPSQDKEHNFCSKQCHDQYQSRNKIKLTCKICGNDFYRSPSWLSQKAGYYCSITCRNESEEWKQNACIQGNMIQQQNKGLNKLELLGNEILDEIGVEYITQKLMFKKFVVDVYLPKQNIVIQWDGDYWHGFNIPYQELDHRQKKRVDLDKSQDAYFKKAGVVILRFWEHQVHNERMKVIENIKKRIQ